MTLDLDELAIKLFRDQAVTVAKSESSVRLSCDNADDANLLFEWLTSLGHPDVTDWGIDTLELPFQVIRNLSDNGIETIGELVQRSMEDLIELRGIGVTTLLQIKSALRKVGCELKPGPDAKSRAWINEHIRDELRRKSKLKPRSTG